MKKAESLRRFVQLASPQLRKHPDTLHLFINAGSVATRRGRGLGFEYHYTVELLVTDYPHPVDTLVVPIMAWIEANQPSLIDELDKRDQAIAIEAEQIAHDKTDIVLKLALSERVLVKPVPGGGWSCEHLDEPTQDELAWAVLVFGDGVDTGAAPAL